MTSPQRAARIAGLLYLIVIASGAFAEFFTRARLIVPGDAAATAANILKSEQVFRLGLAADLVADACYVAVIALLYVLLKPAGRRVSLMAAFFGLTGCAIMGANLVNHVAPLLLLGGAPTLHAFRPDQLQALALTALRLHAYGYAISMVFFAIYCILLGTLVIRSGFLPRLVGGLLAIGGLCSLADCFGAFLALPVPDLGLATLAGEGSLTLWLLMFGVDAARWNERAAAA